MKNRCDKGTFLGLPLNKNVTIPSLVFIVLILIITTILGGKASSFFSDIQGFVSLHASWAFILIVNIILGFCLYLSFSKYGRVRLGGQDAEPEFSTLSWLAMLFSAGMGIGLLFFGVAEPILHYTTNPKTFEVGEAVSAQLALTFTYLHWGLHGWALYALVAGALAYFAYNKKFPLALRSAFYPLIKNKIYGNWGNLIDSIALVAALFGLATSLGFGVLQFTSGLNHLFQIKDTLWLEVGSVLVISSIATLSVYSGINKGVKILSSWNMRVALFLLFLIICMGPTTFIFRSFIQDVGHYFSKLIEYSFWSESYWGTKEKSLWQSDWTIYYWSWWCSWSPFVGIFIARISKGRTLKQFFLGVLFVPSLLTFFWFSVFGGTAIRFELLGNHTISNAVKENMSNALFSFFDQFPFSMILSIIALVLIVSFFVTSADSGALVIDLLASGGRSRTTKKQKVFWSMLIAVVTIILLVVGGLQALQTMVLLTGLPFGLLLLFMAYSWHKSLKESFQKKAKKQKEKIKMETINEIMELIKDEENEELEEAEKAEK